MYQLVWLSQETEERGMLQGSLNSLFVVFFYYLRDRDFKVELWDVTETPHQVAKNGGDVPWWK